MSDAPAQRRVDDPQMTAPVDTPNLPALEDDDDDHGPRLEFSARSLLPLGGFLLASIAALYFLLPQLAGLNDTWHRIENGSPYWMLVAFLCTGGMYGAYVAMFRGVFLRVDDGGRIDWKAAYQITMAGLAASRIFAAGGAGGLVLQAWALRRAGLPRRRVADTTLSFLILTDFPYVLALIVCGIGLRIGLFPGQNTFALTVLPAIGAGIALAIGLAIALVPTDLQRRLHGIGGSGRFGRLLKRLANAPASASAGMRDAIAHARSGDPALLGAFAFWGFQIGVLYAAFRAFGEPPPLAVLIQAFFLGMIGNLLPMPGGVGGVEGGMIGAFAAFGVDSGLAVVAVLVFRGFTFWLPLVPGVIAYFQLRRTVERWRYTIQSEVKDSTKGANPVHGT
jgi:uncharacterized membrane protein YbhN (UPF0104 family)